MHRISKIHTVAFSCFLFSLVTMTSMSVHAQEKNYSNERFATRYSVISKEYQAKKYAGEPVIINIEENLDKESRSFLTDKKQGYENQVADISHQDEIKIRVTVPETALYQICFDYLSYDSSILPIELSFKIDAEYPFYEARSLSFETTWVQEDGVDKDRYGNEIVSLPDKKIQWESKYLMDASYRYSAPLCVELEEGEHEFCIGVKEGSLLLGNLTLCAPKEVPVYKESMPAEGNALISIEAENFSTRNNSSIHAVGEYDQAISPLSAKETVLNIVDEDSFRKAGQTITYSFEVEVSGCDYVLINDRQ